VDYAMLAWTHSTGLLVGRSHGAGAWSHGSMVVRVYARSVSSDDCTAMHIPVGWSSTTHVTFKRP
jgi:hypothetical protein